MTNQQKPEALRLADEFKLCNEYDSIPSINDIAKAEAELRRLNAENERLAALVDAQQPAPSAASKAALAAIRAANMQLVRTGDDEFMLVKYKNAEAQCDGGKCGIGGYCEQCPAARATADSAQDEPLQAFDSPRAKALMRAWEEGWAACRDAEYVGEEAQNDAFNSSNTLTLCIAEDQQLPASQADSQPAPTDWYEGITEKHFDLAIHKAVQRDRAARAPADSVLEAAALSSEQQRAIFEAYESAASESYFEVRQMTVELLQAIGQYIVAPICAVLGLWVFFWGIK